MLCETGTLIAQSWTSSSLGNVDLRSALRATRRTCSPATASPRHSAEGRCRPGRSRPVGAVQTAAIISATRGRSTGSIVAVPSGRDRHRRDGDPFLAHWTGMTQRGRTNLHASSPDQSRSTRTPVSPTGSPKTHRGAFARSELAIPPTTERQTERSRTSASEGLEDLQMLAGPGT